MQLLLFIASFIIPHSHEPTNKLIWLIVFFWCNCADRLSWIKHMRLRWWSSTLHSATTVKICDVDSCFTASFHGTFIVYFSLLLFRRPSVIGHSFNVTVSGASSSIIHRPFRSFVFKSHIRFRSVPISLISRILCSSASRKDWEVALSKVLNLSNNCNDLQQCDLPSSDYATVAVANRREILAPCWKVW